MIEMNLPDVELSGKSIPEIPDITLTQRLSVSKPYYIPKEYIVDVKLTMQINVNVVDSSGAWDLKAQVDTSLSKTNGEPSDFHKEQQAFNAMKEQIKREYPGRYVAIYKQKVVDSHEDVSILITRFYEKYGKVTVYISKPDQASEEVLTPLDVIE